ncbi:hypothetical protein G6N75_02355 [Thioalkalivibrio sp. XN8]|nr:hypothetical protein [Thioalkalivibrio sp. XN8]
MILIATIAWCNFAMASGHEDVNSFIDEGDAKGFHTYWNTKPDGEGGWKYAAGWMDSSGLAVEEQEFFSDGRIDSAEGGTPTGGPQEFHDWASGHGFSTGSGTWGALGQPCGIFHVCDDTDVY